MKTKEFVEKNKGQDGLVGRPVRLNQIVLDSQKGEAELLFFGDVHWGHPQCQEKKARDMLEWALKSRVYVLLMGDLLEAGLRDSVGDSVYQQRLNPQSQMEEVIELLQPLAKAGLIIGMHDGNHEFRITKSTGINITKIMAKLLGVRYLGYSCWSLLSVGNQKYTLYSTHGSSGSRFKHTKMKAVMDLTQWIDADIIAMGHVHSVAAEPVLKQQVDVRNRIVVEKKCYTVLTGSYLAWDKSYAQMMNMPITKLGSPKGILSAEKHDFNFRV